MAIAIQRTLKPSCWYRRARSDSAVRMGLSASIVAPQETHRPFAGTGLFFAPHEGQFTDVGDFAAAMAG
jgi:hypothetical protein